MYRYSVHNFSDQTNNGGEGILNSPAKVEVYDYTGIIATYNPSTFTSGSGNTWRVFEIYVSGGSMSFSTINNYVYASTSSDIDAFKNNTDKTQVTFKMSDF